jgi:hypothetical protein
VTGTKPVRSSGRFQRGYAKVGGRRRGTPNKATRAVSEFLSDLIDRPEVQDVIRDRILKGDTAAFLRALEHVIGKPKQAVELNKDAQIVFRWASR